MFGSMTGGPDSEVRALGMCVCIAMCILVRDRGFVQCVCVCGGGAVHAWDMWGW